MEELLNQTTPVQERTDPNEVGRHAGIGYSDISPPNTSTFGPIHSSPRVHRGTSKQMPLSYKGTQSPGTSKPYTCANCGHRFATEDMLISHVVESEGGSTCCRTYYRQWRKYRENHRKQHRVFLTKNNAPRFPGLGICQNTNISDDGNIQNPKARCQARKRKSDDDDGILHHQPKKHA